MANDRSKIAPQMRTQAIVKNHQESKIISAGTKEKMEKEKV